MDDIWTNMNNVNRDKVVLEPVPWYAGNTIFSPSSFIMPSIAAMAISIFVRLWHTIKITR